MYTKKKWLQYLKKKIKGKIENYHTVIFNVLFHFPTCVIDIDIDTKDKDPLLEKPGVCNCNFIKKTAFLFFIIFFW